MSTEKDEENIQDKVVKGVKLGELCEITSSTRIYASEYQDEGIPFYRGKEIIKKQKGELEKPEKFISEDRYLEIKSERDVPAKGDLLLTSVGTIGVPYVVTDDEQFYFKDGNVIWFKNFDQLLSNYLYYWFLSYKGRSKLEQIKIGSSQSAFTISGLEEVKIDLPSIDHQKSVVKSLSNFDDLIENNKRRIEILEEMAETIYREWFVNFNFPGSEDAEMKESEIGLIPENFQVKTLREVCEVITGYAFSSDNWQDSGIPVVKIKNIKEDHTVDIDNYDCIPKDLITKQREKYLLENGSLLVAMTGATAGKVGKLRTNKKMVLNQRVADIRPKEDLFYEYIWASMTRQNARKELFGLADGTAQPNMSGKQIRNLDLLVPPKELLNKFHSKTKALLKFSDKLFLCNRVLRQTRDLLIPKLISGEIEV